MQDVDRRLAAEELLSVGGSLSMNPRWRRIQRELETSVLPGKTVKLEVGGADLYVKTGWFGGTIVYIEVTFSRSHDEDGTQDDNGQHDDERKRLERKRRERLETTRANLARAAIADACGRATELLQTGQVSLGHVLAGWSSDHHGYGYPEGICPQLRCTVNGPMQAVARLIRERILEWGLQLGQVHIVDGRAVPVVVDVDG